MESKYFIYDGISSLDFGIYLVRTDPGMVETPFFGGHSVKEEFVRNRNTSYFFGVDKEPLEFNIQISPVEKEWTKELKEEVAGWLIQEEYKPFQLSKDLEKIYYGIVTEMPSFHTYSNRGYVEITVKTNSPYAWTVPTYSEFDLSDNSDSAFIELENKSNIGKTFYPIIDIQNRTGKTYEVIDGEKVYNSKIELINHSNHGASFSIDGFESVDERISIDNENEVIVSDLHQSEPFKRFNRKWLELVPGTNRIEVIGECKIWTRMQFPILR